jgi:hypothetical protein
LAGLRKREQILAAALRESRRRRQRRIVVRGTLASAALIGIAVLWTHRPVEVRNIARPIVPIPPGNLAATAPVPTPSDPPRVLRYRPPEIVIRYVPTDPQLATRMAAPRVTGAIARITDDQLLDQLAEAHQPAGLARLKGKAVILYRNR